MITFIGASLTNFSFNVPYYMITTIGEGWITITIQAFSSFTYRCDDSTECDPYVKIVINEGQQVYKTRTITNNDLAIFMETFKSNKIGPSSIIRVEVWDEDDFLTGGDDLRLSYTLQFGDHTKRRDKSLKLDHRLSTLQINMVWEPEYSP